MRPKSQQRADPPGSPPRSIAAAHPNPISLGCCPKSNRRSTSKLDIERVVLAICMGALNRPVAPLKTNIHQGLSHPGGADAVHEILKLDLGLRDLADDGCVGREGGFRSGPGASMVVPRTGLFRPRGDDADARCARLPTLTIPCSREEAPKLLTANLPSRVRSAHQPRAPKLFGLMAQSEQAFVQAGYISFNPEWSATTTSGCSWWSRPGRSLRGQCWPPPLPARTQ